MNFLKKNGILKGREYNDLLEHLVRQQGKSLYLF
jgi:hypothetical protein